MYQRVTTVMGAALDAAIRFHLSIIKKTKSVAFTNYARYRMIKIA